MQQIDIDFEVWKTLTGRRENESHSYNDVLRQLLGLRPRAGADDETGSQPSGGGRAISGRFLPDGTQLQATYKGREFRAEIKNGALVGSDGETHASASAAARAITNTQVNGLAFWRVKRPGDTDWRKIALIAKSR